MFRNFAKSGLKIIAAICIGVLGLPVLLGLSMVQTANVAGLVLWRTMPFSAALGSLVFGIATICILLGFRKIAAGCGLVIFVLGLGSVATRLCNFESELATLLKGISVFGSIENFSLLMPISSAACYVALGVIAGLLSQKNVSGRTYSIAAHLAVFPAAVGIITICGRAITGFHSMSIGSFAHINIVTATALALAGSATFFLTLKAIGKSKHESFRQIPTLITVILISSFIAIWQLQLADETSSERAKVAAEALRIKMEMTQTLKETSLALERFASRVEYLGTSDKKYLDLDGKNYLQQIPILKRIGIINANSKVSWSYPNAISSQVDGFDQSQDQRRREALEKAKQSRRPALSRVIELRSGGLGFLLPVPLFPKGKFSGFVYATVEAAKIFKSFEYSPDFQVVITDADQTVFSSRSTDRAYDTFTQTESLSWGYSQWEIRVTPTERLLRRWQSGLPYFTLFFGVLLSLIFGAYLQGISSSRKEALVNAESVRVLNLRLAIALNAAKMAAFNLNLLTHEVWRSEEHDKIFGYEAQLDNWTLAQFAEHVVPEDRARVSEELGQAVKTDVSNVEFRILRVSDRSVRWLSVMTQIIVDENNIPIQLIGIVRDITSEKQAELERQSALEWRKAVLNASEYAIISTDPNGIVMTYNAGGEKMLGYAPSEMIGNPVPLTLLLQEEVEKRSKALSTELGESVEVGFETIVAKARMLRVADANEWMFVRKDLTQFPASLSVTVLHDSQGAIAGYLGVVIDLTEAKKAQQELLITNERLQRVIEATGEGIWEREYISGGKIRFMDEQAKRIFGIPDDVSFDYQQVFENVWPDDRETLQASILNHIQNSTSGFDVEFRMTQQRSGQIVWIHARGKVIQKPGETAQLISTVKDVTAEVQRKAQLQDALLAAQDATRAKSEFLANMSHEIRTPLNGVIGMTGLLLDTELGPTQKEYAEIVRSSAEILLGLINDILDFSKIEARKMDLEELNFDVEHVTLNIVRLLELGAKNKGLKIGLSLDAGLPTQFFRGDPNRIGQILANLLGNAIKFTEEGEVFIKILSEKTDSSAESFFADQVTIRFEVSDTGIGMSPAALQKMFQPFTQADASTTRRFGGTGLGLSISKHLVEMMGGEIGVESEEKIGSTFWFTLVLKKGQPIKSAAPHKPIPIESLAAGKKVRILLVEDNVVNQMIAIKMLERGGFRIDAVANGREAVDAVKAIPYDLVLMDCQMPILDGYEATREIRANNNEPSSRVPIIAMTANAMIGDRERCLEAGMDEYVVKPIKAHHLIEAISRVLTERKAAS